MKNSDLFSRVVDFTFHGQIRTGHLCGFVSTGLYRECYTFNLKAGRRVWTWQWNNRLIVFAIELAALGYLDVGYHL